MNAIVNHIILFLANPHIKSNKPTLHRPLKSLEISMPDIDSQRLRECAVRCGQFSCFAHRCEHNVIFSKRIPFIDGDGNGNGNEK